MSTLIDGGFTSVHFESVHELLNFKPTQQNHRQYNDPLGREKEGWYGEGNKTGQDVINHALLGWREGYVKLADMMRQLNEPGTATPIDEQVKKRTRKRYKSDQGYELDIHAVNQGRLTSA